MLDFVIFYPEGHETHAEFGHPERPERVEVIRKTLEEQGVWQGSTQLKPIEVPNEVLESIHSKAYLEQLESTSKVGGRLDMDTYTTPTSWDLALKAVGGAIAVAKTVWNGESERGFALTRPPGHHATINRGMGFCLLNNVAIAAEYLFQVEGALRLAIVDLDLHHGNGTQDIFWSREDVFYFSTHQYPHYPGSGALREIGGGRGEGMTANFPMPPMSGDEAYRTVMREAILPLIRLYKPDMILVSYGFDIHWKDPLGNIILSAEGYRGLIRDLVNYADEACQGRIALFLEGGYDLDAAVACSLGVVSALSGLQWEDLIGPSPLPESNAYRVMLEQARAIWGL